MLRPGGGAGAETGRGADAPPLEGFPPNERQNVAVAVERERESIWLRAAPLRRRVRELEVRLQRMEDRIGAADPVVTAASADVERGYLPAGRRVGTLCAQRLNGWVSAQ